MPSTSTKNRAFISAFLLTLSLLIPWTPLPAQSSEPLFSFDHLDTLSDPRSLDISDVVEAWPIEIDPARVASSPDELIIDLPGIGTVTAHLSSFNIWGPNYASWDGRVHSNNSRLKDDGFVHLVLFEGTLTGVLNIEAERYQIVWTDTGYRLARLELASPICAFETADEDSEASPRSPLAVPTDARVNAETARTNTPSQIPTHVQPGLLTEAITWLDIVALYPSSFLSSVSNEQSVRNFIASSVSLANSIFINNGVNARYRISHMGPLLGTQPPGTDLRQLHQWLNTQPVEVQQIRNAAGGDIVGLFVPQSFSTFNVCGIANLPKADGTLEQGSPNPFPTPGQFGQRAFSTMRSQCGLNDYTFGHEIGHNYGMRHETGSTSTTNLFPNGRGLDFFVSGAPKSTAMACQYNGGPVTGAVCRRIPYFSNPNQTYQGVTIGAKTRDNVSVAKAKTGPYANFRPAPAGCVENSTTLCLQNRFKVRATFNGSSQALKRSYTSTSGFFHFGNSANLEIGVKMIDGRAVNNRWWFFHGAMTTLAYNITVTDTQTGRVQTYNRPASTGTQICGGADTIAFAGIVNGESGSAAAVATPNLEMPGQDLIPSGVAEAACSPGAGRICLFSNRFKVEVKRSGSNQNGATLSNLSGFFYFTSSSNVEVPVKIIDGRSVNGKFWFFFGSETSLAYQVVVTDTTTGLVKTYNSPAAHCGIADAAAF